MPTKKFVLKRKYKNYTDPYAQDWYNAIFRKDNFQPIGVTRIQKNQAAINAADYVESMYRHHLRKYKAERDSIESNPNFVGPPSPKGFISDNIKTALQFSNYDSSLFGPYNDNYPDKPSDYEKYKNAKKLGGNIRKKADGGTFWQQTGMTPWDLAGAGVQFTGNLASSLINQGAINRLKFTPIHTMTVAEAPVKFNTNYNINPQLGNLRESLGSIEREVTNNSASSRNRIGRITGSRFRGIGAYNELYGHKLNQETNMMNAEAQNRQGVYARNTTRLQQNIARDTAYNTQGQDNLDNTKTSLTGQNWTNFTQNTADSLVQAYNRGQHRLSDATSLAYLLARDIDAAKIFTGKENPTFDDIWNHAYISFGIPGRRQTKLGGRSSLIR